MICSIEIPPPRRKLSAGVQAAWLMVVLLMIMASALYCVFRFDALALVAEISFEVISIVDAG